MSSFKATLALVAILFLAGFIAGPIPNLENETGGRVSDLPPNSLNMCLDVNDVYELSGAAALSMEAFPEKLKEKVEAGKCYRFPHPLSYLRTLQKFTAADGDQLRIMEFFWPEHPQEKFYTFMGELPPGMSLIDWKPGIFDQAGTLPDGRPKFFPMTKAEELWFQDDFVRGCCNIGDAFISDYFFEKDGKYYAEITDGYDHHPQVLRGIIKPGTIREIPEAIMRKMRTPDSNGKLPPQNPTSHGIIFLHLYYNSAQEKMIGVGGKTNAPEDAEVLCYWPPSLN